MPVPRRFLRSSHPSSVCRNPSPYPVSHPALQMHLHLYLADVKFLVRRPQLRPANPVPVPHPGGAGSSIGTDSSAIDGTDLSQSVRVEVMKEDSVVCENEDIAVPSVARSPSVTTPSSVLTTATKAESSSNQVAFTEVTQNIKASPDSTATHASPVSSSDNTGSVGRPASADSCPLPTTPNTTEDSSIMEAFIGELKSRLSRTRTKMPTVVKADSFAIAGSSYKIDSDKQPAPTTQTRRALAPIQNRFISGVFVGTQTSVSPKDVHHHLTPTDILSSQVLPRDDNDDCNPPGVDFTVTELKGRVLPGTRVSLWS
ncbi:hypothetical protein B0H14DRAFT_3864952 [Mycena olivaceomarginata]|nr:hypothetical protein B0H14DRAFT_3864952 [Mycena olivaceomarginata]